LNGDSTHFGLTDAFRLGLRYIRGRGQAPVNIASISLASAFYAYIALMRMGTQTLRTYRLWLLSVAVIVAAVSMATVMLISVYERYREIGVLKCLGALDRHVFLLLIVEALIQGLIGGGIGILLGSISILISNTSTSLSGVNYLGLSSTLLLSTLISIVSSLYPAYRAMRLNPIEALRYEV